MKAARHAAGRFPFGPIHRRDPERRARRPDGLQLWRADRPGNAALAGRRDVEWPNDRLQDRGHAAADGRRADRGRGRQRLAAAGPRPGQGAQSRQPDAAGPQQLRQGAAVLSLGFTAAGSCADGLGIRRHGRARQLGADQGKIAQFDACCLVGPDHYWANYFASPAVVGRLLPYIFSTSRAGSPRRRRARHERAAPKADSPGGTEESAAPLSSGAVAAAQ